MKVTLRPLCTDDGPRVLVWRNAPEVAAQMYSDHEITGAEHAAWLSSALKRDDAHYWIIEADEEPAGFASIVLRDVASGRWELGHYIGEAAFRGRGIGAAVEYLILRHAFAVVGAHKLWAEVLAENERAWRLHEAFGYQREALLRAHVVKGGRLRDVVAMGILKVDWDEAKPDAEARLIARGFALKDLQVAQATPSAPSAPIEPRLTSLAHGGGCGCKIAPAVLHDILSSMPPNTPFRNLLVGAETSDDAAVWKLNDQQALVATTDFFMPIVDDPFDFGRIAATNALSDIYAMGGTPIFALAIVGMPVNVLSLETIRRVLEGGASVCAAADVPIAGGHSIDSVEPIYGLVALGLVHPDRVLTNRTARAGDVLILTKPIGVGVLSAALKQGKLNDAGYGAMIASTTQLNTIGADLPAQPGVHALTDVTGFGLLGHAREMAMGSKVRVVIDANAAPYWDGVEALAKAGVRTGASARNWSSLEAATELPADFPEWRRDLLCDPQTSGGLLISVAAAHAPALVAFIRDRGFAHACQVGVVEAGAGDLQVIASAEAA